MEEMIAKRIWKFYFIFFCLKIKPYRPQSCCKSFARMVLSIWHFWRRKEAKSMNQAWQRKEEYLQLESSAIPELGCKQEGTDWRTNK